MRHPGVMSVGLEVRRNRNPRPRFKRRTWGTLLSTGHPPRKWTEAFRWKHYEVSNNIFPDDVKCRTGYLTCTYNIPNMELTGVVRSVVELHRSGSGLAREWPKLRNEAQTPAN